MKPVDGHLLVTRGDVAWIAQQEVQGRAGDRTFTVLRLELAVFPFAAILAKGLGIEVVVGVIAPEAVAPPLAREQVVQVGPGLLPFVEP